MKMEIWLGRMPMTTEGETYGLEFEDYGSGKAQFNVAMIKHDKEGKEVERKSVGLVNKVDVVRVAKAT